MVKKLEPGLTRDVTIQPSLALVLISTVPCPIFTASVRRNGEGDRRMDWKTLLAYITGTVDQELLGRNEYLATENRILRNQIKGRVQLSDGERKALADIGQKLGKQALEEVATIVRLRVVPQSIRSWKG